MSKIAKSKSLFHIVPKNSELMAQINKFKLNGINYKTLYPGEQLSDDVSTCFIQYINNFNITGWEQLIGSHFSARFCFELSGNSNSIF